MSLPALPAQSPAQKRLIARLIKVVQRDLAVQRVYLVGSLSGSTGPVDGWSDVDLWVIVRKGSRSRFERTTKWLHGLGRVLGEEAPRQEQGTVIQAVFEDGLALDVVFSPVLGRRHAKLLWARPGSRRPVLSVVSSSPRRQTRQQQLKDANSFWLTAEKAIKKVVRNDLLIGWHLALSLAQDCLVLQMRRRDLRAGTTVHRVGGWGNAIVNRLSGPGDRWDRMETLQAIERYASVYDSMACADVPGYKSKISIVRRLIRRAEADIRMAE